MNLEEFLRSVITTPEGYFCLSVKPASETRFWEEWFHWPSKIDSIIQRANDLREIANVYFSPYLFSEPKSIKDNVLGTRTIVADLDEADIAQLNIIPTYLVETSPNRHQGYWILTQELPLSTHEILSRKLTYSIPLCDHSGWSLGHKFRLIETFNHKYLEGTYEVKVVSQSGITYEPSVLELLPDVLEETATTDNNWLDKLPTSFSIGPYELLESIKDRIPVKLYLNYSVESNDRSRSLWALMCAAFRAGLNREEVFWLSKGSANNKFERLRHNGDRELAKDVLRAEQVVNSSAIDIRKAVLEARKVLGIPTEKRTLIFTLVLDQMKKLGQFIHTDDDNTWYIRKDLGRPIIIAVRSEYLDMILDLQYGLNATEIEQTFVVNGLSAYCRNLPTTATTGYLSHYEQNGNFILLHSGKKTVYKVTSTGIDTITNGSYGVVFPWITSNETFEPDFSKYINWGDVLYDSALNNLLNMDKQQAKTTLKVWLLFLLMRNVAVSRPIIAFLGQPGSGKSTLFRRLYRFLYGKKRDLNAVTTAEDFDHSVSVDPLVVMDNVDTWQPWLPDRLAISAATSDIVKRKLYTDVDTITMKRQALLGVTAHNPKFGREDVTDRFLLFNFQRLEHFLPEGTILDYISENRNLLWGSIITDLQLVLNTPNPHDNEIPQFRIEDFARTGYRIAKAIGEQDYFLPAMKHIASEQRIFVLEEESTLTSAINKMVRRRKGQGSMTMAQLWTELEACSDDKINFVKTYKNAAYLSKKLWVMAASLKESFTIEVSKGIDGGRLWYIGAKDVGNERLSNNGKY